MSTDGARAELSRFLSQYGLAALTDWALEQLVRGVSFDQIKLDLRQQPAYKLRFPAMQSLSDSGRAMTEAEYIGYEQAVVGIMRQSGLPPKFYDQPSDFADLMSNGVSVAEVADRVSGAYQKVMTAPQDVRDAFANMYGPGSDDAFAAFVLDPVRAQPVIQKQVNAALAVAQGGRVGLNISQGVAEGIGATLSEGEAQGAIRQAGSLKPLTEQTLLEEQSGTSITGDDLVSGIAGLTSSEKTKKALADRAAMFQGQGGAVQSKEGVFGLGGSQQ